MSPLNIIFKGTHWKKDICQLHSTSLGAFFNPKVSIFFLFLHENMLWVLIRSASPRHF